MSYKGKFTPRNPQKYKGDPNNIIYRSTWEVRVMKYLDEHPNVIWWGSEELPIPYFSPVDKKKHRYFPDFIAKMRKADGTVITYVIEVKPENKSPKLSRLIPSPQVWCSTPIYTLIQACFQNSFHTNRQ